MVSFSCESCGDILTKKKLDPHRGRCKGQFTCLDCQTTFKGTEYRAHTSCISEAQKYQGKLYKEPKKGPKPKQQKPPTDAPAQTIVEKKKKMEALIVEADSRVAVVEMVPRAPTPPAAFNVFDFLVQNGDTPAPSAHPLETPVSSDLESSSEEDDEDDEDSSSAGDEEDSEESDSDSMDTDEPEPDPVQSAADAARQYMKAELFKQGFAHASTVENPFETPAPARGHQRNISATSAESGAKESTKKRKRGSPEELDLSSAKQYKANTDVDMTDVPAPLHSGLTGGLKTLLSRPELPPSPPDIDGSPHSPLKRSKQAKIQKSTKSETSAQKDKKESKKSKAREKESKKEKKDKSKEGKTVVVKDPKTGQWIRKRVRKDSAQTADPPAEQNPSASASDPSLQRSKQQLAIEYNNHSHAADDTLPTPANAVVVHSKKAVSRAESFLATAIKDAGQARGRGCSVKKALKRFSRERGRKSAAAEMEKELWKVLRLRLNDRGEVVLFVEGAV